MEHKTVTQCHAKQKYLCQNGLGKQTWTIFGAKNKWIILPLVVDKISEKLINTQGS